MNALTGFGERLKSAIKNSNYSQKEISEILQINQDTITNYVREKSLPKADALFSLCRLLKISSDWLLTGESPNEKKPEEQHPPKEDKPVLNGDIGKLSDYEIEMILKFRQLDYEAKEDVFGFLIMKHDRKFKGGTLFNSNTGGTDEEAAASEAV